MGALVVRKAANWWIDMYVGKHKMGKGKISDPNDRLKIRGDQGLPRKLGEISPSEFRLHGDSGVGSRIDSLLLVGPEKIELACDRDACARNDLERFETGISHLRTSAVLAVLNNGVV
jgi:hypothetical protein